MDFYGNVADAEKRICSIPNHCYGLMQVLNPAVANNIFKVISMELNLRHIWLKSVIGFLIYAAVINLIIYFKYGLSLTPRQWLIQPIVNLYGFSAEYFYLVWFILICSEIIAHTLFIVNDKKM